MLPHTVAFMADRAPRAVARLAGALGAGGDYSAVARVAELAALAGPRTLADLGIEEDRIPAIASTTAAHPGSAATPGGVTEQELLELLARAL